MGYLDKSTITVDAILTNRGRELLSRGTGTGGFNISKFAVADDEVDYRLYNVAHPLGSNYYGAIIENMPVLEATPDETQIMRYKLVTVTGTEAQGTVAIPQITGISTTLPTLYFTPVSGESNSVDIEPKTTFTGATNSSNQETDGYTLILADGDAATVELLNPSTGIVSVNERGSVVASGKKFRITAKEIARTTSIGIFGNNSGAVYNYTLTTAISST
jgi:hypothetical protein